MRALPVCLVVLALVACGSGQEWLGQQQVSAPDTTTDGQPSIAFDTSGRAWVVWVGLGADYDLAYSRWLGDHWDEERGVGPDIPGVIAKFKPCVTFDARGSAWLVWHNAYANNNRDIAFCRWQDTCWGPEAQVNQPDSNDLDFAPRIACGGGQVWCVWYGGTYHPNPQTVYASRWDSIAGAWGPEMHVSPPDGNSHWFCDVKVDVHGTPHVVWCTEPLYTVFYSYFDGSRWAPPVPVNDTAAVQASPRADPHLAIDRDGVMHLSFTGAWVGATTRDVFYSRNDGSGWIPCQMVTQDSSYQEWYSSIAARSVDDIWVIFDRQGEGPDQFRVYASHFDGREWLPEERLDSDSAYYDGEADVALASVRQPWVVWSGTVSAPNSEVFCNRRAAASLVEPWSAARPKGSASLLLQSPVAGSVFIQCRLAAAGIAFVSVFDMAGRCVANRSLTAGKPGRYRVALGTLPSGVYVCRLSGQGQAAVQKFAVVGD